MDKEQAGFAAVQAMEGLRRQVFEKKNNLLAQVVLIQAVFQRPPMARYCSVLIGFTRDGE
jgi:hypothetical protein